MKPSRLLLLLAIGWKTESACSDCSIASVRRRLREEGNAKEEGGPRLAERREDWEHTARRSGGGSAAEREADQEAADGEPEASPQIGET